MAVSATGVMPALARVLPEREKPGQRPVLHAAHGATCHIIVFARRTCEREEQVEMEGGTFEDRPAEWSWTPLSPPAGPREWMPRRQM